MATVVDSIVDGAVDLVKSYFPPDMSDADKAKLRQDMNALIVQSTVALEQEATKRAQADMGSDSWLSKNIRPLIMIYLLVVFTGFAIVSSIYDINVIYVDLLQDMLMASFGFYFAGRTIEKVTSLITKK